MRKLASIQKLTSLSPIEGADSIEHATVLGWHLVVKKDEFKVNDLVVYCEVDSILPDKPEFEFLRPRGMRIKTVKLRGQISQGICFPLSILPEGFNIEEDADCTEAIGVVKYELPDTAVMGGNAKGSFPGFIPKTDETRVQGLYRLLQRHQDTVCYITEKVDGSSVTYYLKDGEFGVCSRNLELKDEGDTIFWKMARTFDIENKLRSLGRNISLQGEIIGEGIQKNKLKLKGHTVKFFNVFDIDKYEYLRYAEFRRITEQLGLETVPIIDENYVLVNDIDSLVKMSMVKSKIAPGVWAEGIVIRSKDDIFDQDRNQNMENMDRISFKVINPNFLLKFDE